MKGPFKKERSPEKEQAIASKKKQIEDILSRINLAISSDEIRTLLAELNGITSSLGEVPADLEAIITEAKTKGEQKREEIETAERAEALKSNEDNTSLDDDFDKVAEEKEFSQKYAGLIDKTQKVEEKSRRFTEEVAQHLKDIDAEGIHRVHEKLKRGGDLTEAEEKLLHPTEDQLIRLDKLVKDGNEARKEKKESSEQLKQLAKEKEGLKATNEEDKKRLRDGIAGKPTAEPAKPGMPTTSPTESTKPEAVVSREPQNVMPIHDQESLKIKIKANEKGIREKEFQEQHHERQLAGHKKIIKEVEKVEGAEQEKLQAIDEEIKNIEAKNEALRKEMATASEARQQKIQKIIAFNEKKVLNSKQDKERIKSVLAQEGGRSEKDVTRNMVESFQVGPDVSTSPLTPPRSPNPPEPHKNSSRYQDR